MKEFSCGDVVPGCTAAFRGVDDESLLSQVAKHAQKDHGLKELPPELIEQVRRKIRTVKHD